MAAFQLARRTGALIELALAALVLAGLAASIVRGSSLGYPPQPFSYDPSDSFMDLYNPAYWSHRADAYTRWRAVYPPLSFLMLRWTSWAPCYVQGPLSGRACDQLSMLLLGLAWAGGCVLAFAGYRKMRLPNAGLRTVALGLGYPMLYALDRGNVLVFAFVLTVLAEPLVSPRARYVALAAAANFKPYLLVLAIPDLVARRWGGAAAVFGLAGLIYAASLLLFGGGSPAVLVNNVRYLIGLTAANYWNNLYASTSYGGLIAHLAHSGTPAGRLLWIPVALGEAGALAVLVLAWRRGGGVEWDVLAGLLLAGVMTAFGASGYAAVFLVWLAFRQRWSGPAAAVVLVAAYLVSIPFDLVIRAVPQAPVVAYWSGRLVAAQVGISVGQLLRPALVLIIQYGFIGLALASLRRAEPEGDAQDAGLGSGAGRSHQAAPADPGAPRS